MLEKKGEKKRKERKKGSIKTVREGNGGKKSTSILTSFIREK